MRQLQTDYSDGDGSDDSRRRDDFRACDVTIVAHDIGPVGGMERVLTELITGLTRLGHHVTVIARACELAPNDKLTFHRVRAPKRPFFIAYLWFMLAGSVAVRRWRRGVVQTTGAIVLNQVDCIAVHYCHRVGRSTPSRQTLIFRANALISHILKRFGEGASFRANRKAVFVCVSQGVADEMREHYPRLAEQLVTIHNGVNTKTFCPGENSVEAARVRVRLGIPQDRLIAVLVGSEWERKGLEPALRAVARATSWDLVVAGAGDESHYQALADDLGIGGSVHWLGVVREVQVVYELGDAFLLPSSYETFSLVTFEAAASGLPVLVTPLSGISELVHDRENGFLITQEPGLIARRLDELGEDSALRARLGETARQAALQFSWEAMVAKHHELYRRLAASSDVEVVSR